VDPRASLDDLEKRKFLTLPGLELRPLGRPARSQSLYRLRYPCSLVTDVSVETSAWIFRVEYMAGKRNFHILQREDLKPKSVREDER
jgi:hypothetical protein